MSDQYHICYQGGSAENYCDAYPAGMDDLKQQIIGLKDGDSSVEDEDIQIYVLTKFKVKTHRQVQIIEEK